MATTTYFLFLINLLLFPSIHTTASPLNISAVYVFGDSIVDPGNNHNNSLTICRANHPPYGKNFPGHIPTGRFSDGKLTTDFFVSKIGLKELLPAYMNPNLTDQDLLTGCSFATAGSGLDDFSAAQFNVPTLTNQLSYFAEATERLEKKYGSKEVGRVVENGMFLIVTGSNDVMYRSIYSLPIKGMYRLSDYHDLMLGKLEIVIRRLYTMGMRKIAVAGLPPIGCIPIMVTIFSTLTPSLDLMKHKCVNQQNVDSQSYNAKLRTLILKIQQTLPGSRIAYLDIYTPLMDIITNPAAYGYETTDKPCCGYVSMEFGSFCNSWSKICPDPLKYVFWDAAHPTQSVYLEITNYLMKTVMPYFAA